MRRERRGRQPDCSMGSAAGAQAPAGRPRPSGRAVAAGRRAAPGADAEPQHSRDHVLQLAAVDDDVEHAAFEEELAALEALGQRLPDGLLDHPRAGKADERLRLGDVEVAQHREARRHAAGRRIGEQGDVRQARARRAARAHC